MAELDRKVQDDRTAVDRLTGAIAKAAGSVTFILLHAAFFAAWMVFNATRFAFDPGPYSLLNLAVALEAVFLTSVVLLTQNNMARLAERRAHLELQVNLLAEQELTAMLNMLNGLCVKAGVQVAIRDERVQQLLAETDVQRIAVALDKGLDS
jgi:uncharacterized membrane protein